jgi:hypothetical protein
MPMRPSSMSRAIVRSDRTTGRFFHQSIGQSGETLQEALSFCGRQPGQGARERAVARADPGPNLLLGECVQIDERAAAVVGVLTAMDEGVILEVASELACSGQRQAELGGDLAHRARPFRRDVREHGDVPPAERGFPADELQQLVRRPAALPEAAHDAAQELPQLAQLVRGNSHVLVIVIIR